MTVTIRDSGIPRLYRTEWLRSEIGPDSGTLASRLARGLRGLRGFGDVVLPFDVYKAEVNEALARLRRREITDDEAYAIEESAWTRYVATIEEEAQRIEDDAYEFYLEMEKAAFEKHRLPGSDDRVKPEEFDDYERERDAAYAVYEEAIVTADAMRAEVTEHRKERIYVVTGAKPKWIWPGLLALGIVGGGIWALSRGRA